MLPICRLIASLPATGASGDHAYPVARGEKLNGPRRGLLGQLYLHIRHTARFIDNEH
jgi:hypothetical protein